MTMSDVKNQKPEELQDEQLDEVSGGKARLPPESYGKR